MKRCAFLLVVLLPLGLAAEAVDTAWVRRYDGPRHGQDWATCLAVDSLGNVYVAGPSAADTGYVNLDYVVIKYRPDGAVAWERRYDFDGGDDIPSGLGVDRQGNVYVTGSGGGRTATIKYDSIGRLVWLRTYGTQGYASDLVLDADENVLLCGRTLTTTWELATLKVRGNGETAWVRTYSGGEGDDGATAVAVDGADRVVATGYGAGAGTHYDCTTVRYDPAGNELWVARYDGWNHGDDRAYDVAIDKASNVIICGPSDNGYTTPFDYLTIKYSPEGETLWTRRYNGTANGRDEARAVAVDGEGNVYVTGQTQAVGLANECVSVKYGPDGAEHWVARYARNDERSGGYAIAVDDDGCAYVGGWAASPGRFADCMTAKYDQHGETVWVRTWNGAGNSVDYCSAVVLGSGGGVCVAGLTYGAGGDNCDFVTIKYVQGGGIHDSPSSSASRPELLVLPNPSKTSTTIRLPGAVGSQTPLRVRDVTGRTVRVLKAEEGGSCATGMVVWDGCDDEGRRLPAGVYTIIVSAGKTRLMAKVTLLD